MIKEVKVPAKIKKLTVPNAAFIQGSIHLWILFYDKEEKIMSVDQKYCLHNMGKIAFYKSKESLKFKEQQLRRK